MNEAYRQTLPESAFTSADDTAPVTEVGLDRTLADVLREGPLGGHWATDAGGAITQTELDDLMVEAELGRGGMGVVYRAMQLSLNRPVAVKLLDPRQGWSPEQLERFHQEVLLAASVSHPNIAHVHWVRRHDDLFYFVMELVDGPSLAELLSQRRLEIDDVVHLMSQVCDGLQHAHDRGVVHRDLKPGNVLIELVEPATHDVQSRRSGRLGRAVLVDFGLAARHGEASTTAAGQLMGTPAYMSPEQAGGRPTDHRSDLYSLGVTLFEALTGRVPFSAPTPVAMAMRHLAQPPPDPRTVVPELPEPFAALTNELLRKEPRERPPSAAAVRERLQEALAARAAPTTTGAYAALDPTSGPGLARREATALAVQLDGFMGAATDQPLARTTFSLESWMALVDDVVTSLGGALVKQEAALLVATFTESADKSDARTDHTTTAVLALRQLRDALDEFNHTHGRHQAFTAGLERGELFIGELGAPHRPVAFGRPIDAAVALSAVRHCGLGLVGPGLIAHVADELPLEPLIGVADELGEAARIEPEFLRNTS